MSITVKNTEERRLKMHEELLMKVIKDQSCTLQKAFLEGIMNGLEANSEEVRVKVWEQQDGCRSNILASIEDDGIGIQTEEELINHFETFGTPHEDNENTTWKRFRMGRGQLFAYGKNTWRTATFEMVVDIKNKGLTYTLTKGLSPVKGTQILVELYDDPFPDIYRSQDDLADKLKHQIEFMPGRILLNGVQLNTPANDIDKSRWTEYDDDAYYLFGVGSKLTVYNLGAYVMDLPSTDMGVTGVIISRKKLDVNFARGGVHDRCEIWQRAKQIIKKHKPARKYKARTHLEDWEKISLLQDIRDGDCDTDWSKAASLRLLQTTSGRGMTLNEIARVSSHWTFAPVGNQIADKLMQSEESICFDDRVLDDMSYSGNPKNFFTWLVRRQDYNAKQRFGNTSKWYRSWADTSKGFKNTHKLVPQNKWSAVEKRVLRVLNKWHYYFDDRTFSLGTSDTAEAWTDGSTYIVLDRMFLKNLRLPSDSGGTYLMAVIAHELAHDSATDGTHIHGEAFYRAFHDLVCSKRRRSPMDLIIHFNSEMKRLKIDEHNVKEVEKEEKKKAKRDKKLGLTKVEIPKPEVKIAAKMKEPVKVAAKVESTRKMKKKGRVPQGAFT